MERVYYAGSFGKGTMIRESYDLDLVIYWSQNAQFTLKNIYPGVGNALKKHWIYVNSTNVGWELQFKGSRVGKRRTRMNRLRVCLTNRLTSKVIEGNLIL